MSMAAAQANLLSLNCEFFSAVLSYIVAQPNDSCAVCRNGWRNFHNLRHFLSSIEFTNPTFKCNIIPFGIFLLPCFNFPLIPSCFFGTKSVQTKPLKKPILGVGIRVWVAIPKIPCHFFNFSKFEKKKTWEAGNLLVAGNTIYRGDVKLLVLRVIFFWFILSAFNEWKRE